MVTQSLSRAEYSGSLVLCVLALMNYLLFYVVNITLARNLSVRDFDDFSVALSVIAILSTVATLGLDKYALRCIPVYRERGDWAHALGFWKFSLRTMVFFSLFLAAFVGLTLEAILVSQDASSHIAIVILALFLPVIAPALFLVEVVTANGGQIEAVVIYRLLLPITFLLFIWLIFLFDLPMTAVGVVSGYGLAWLWTLGAIHQLARFTMPEEAWRAKPSFLKIKWVRRSVPLLLNSWMLSVMAGSGVIVLELLYPSDAIVGTYAVAAQTGTFIVLLANTANRFYLPLTSLFMERSDGSALRRLMRHRLMVVGGLAVAFLTAVVTFGQAILDWFGPNFSHGYEALCVLAVGASINAVFSDSPYYLQFMKRSRSVFVSTSFAVVINLVLSFFLSERLGVLGAAYGYALSMCFLFIRLRYQTRRHLKTVG
ncbi:oligosaccharide flippase family protein [Methylocaldum sp.]|uniref:oligosaccharide flippase family protein n=1 Tax=Methylocaldum sp. TaxID=1969727 RepID=UPI002D58A5FE|nr:oligosaccharide flippase family protein [Methylocaldum sp.]HYE35940.1 oligosaccharide flippase family protein [Methylocaldum sp.]